ncbi:hypothetical protein TNCV_2928871 [Trichonephila clavipes]|nr:hypothetical protein TNCV_2928871 [Trichonephila clavipes]
MTMKAPQMKVMPIHRVKPHQRVFLLLSSDPLRTSCSEINSQGKRYGGAKDQYTSVLEIRLVLFKSRGEDDENVFEYNRNLVIASCNSIDGPKDSPSGLIENSVKPRHNLFAGT